LTETPVDTSNHPLSIEAISPTCMHVAGTNSLVL